MTERSQPKKLKRFNSLRATLTTAFALLSILSVLLVGSVQTFRNYQAQQTIIFEQKRTAAFDAATQVSAFIEQIFNTLESAAEISRAITKTEQDQQLLVENLMILQPALRQVAWLNNQGQEIIKQSGLTVVTADDLHSHAGRDLFTQVRQGRRYISSVYIGELTTEPLVTLAIPTHDAFGDFVGAFVVEVNLRFMWDLVADLKIGETGQAYVVDKEGNLLAATDTSRVLRGDNVKELTEVADFISGQNQDEGTTSRFSTGIDDTTVLATYIPLGEPNWAVVAEVPVAEVNQVIIQEVSISITVMLIVAILAALAGGYLARRLAHPLLNLTETASQIAAGNLDLAASTAGTTEVGQLANTFNDMTSQLRTLISSLERQIQRLGVAASLSERLNAILNLDELMFEVVNQVRDDLGYYHTHIYLLDEQGENLIMAEGTGAAGQEMKAQGHHIALTNLTSLVARAARNGEAVYIANVHEAPDWRPNRLLPNIQSEIAVPIIMEGEIIGVLDVQSDEVNGLNEGDINLLRSLANQMAVILRNVRQYAEVEMALAEVRKVQEQYIQQAWHKVQQQKQGAAYLHGRTGRLPLQEEEIIRLIDAAQNQPELTTTQTKGTDSQNKGQLIAPIKLQNQLIGAIKLEDQESGQERVWHERDLALVEAVATEVAQIAENLRLFDETRQRADYERTVAELTQRIRQAPNMAVLAKIAADELGLALRASHTLVKIGSDAVEIEVEGLATKH